MVHLSSSVLHILKSPSNLNRVRCYKVHYIALATLRTEKFKISNTYSYLQGESQVYVFHLLVKVRFLPFYEHRLFELFTWYLVAAESRIWKQSSVQDVCQDSELCRCLKTLEDLSESECSHTHVEKCQLVSPTQQALQLAHETL